MKYPSDRSKLPRLILVVSLCFVFLGVSSAPARATFDELGQFGTTLLDHVENAAIKSGLVDLKQKLWKEKGILIKPYFKTSYDLSSNVFHAPNTHSDHTDSIWQFIPGLQYIVNTPYGVIGGAYEATLRYYTQFVNQNEQDQHFVVYGNFTPTENTYLRVTERLKQEGATAGNSAFDPVDYLENTVSAVTGYNAGGFTYEFGYENFDRSYSTDAAKFYNYNENKYDLRVYAKITDTTRVFSGARLGVADFTKNSSRDTHYYEIPIGLDG